MLGSVSYKLMYQVNAANPYFDVFVVYINLFVFLWKFGLEIGYFGNGF